MTRLIAIVAALAAFAVTGTTASADSNLVGRWRLDDGAGTLAADSSGYGDNGTLAGSAAWVGGPDGGGLMFDGASANIRVPDAPQLDSRNAITVSAWIERLGSPGAYKYVVAKGGRGCIAASYGLYSGPNGGLQFYVSRGHGTVYARSPDAGPSVWDGRWHLVVGSFDGTTIRLFVDGAQVGAGTEYPGRIDYELPDSNDLFIGAYPLCGDKNFDGAISDVRVWNTALSAGQVRSLEPTTSPPPPTSSSGNSATPTVQDPGTPVPSPGGALPVLRALKLSASTFSVSAVRQKSVITYADSQPARVRFTILRRVAKARCLKSDPGGKAKANTRCPRYARFGVFTHRDHSGRNRVRIPSRFRLSPGKYLLEATPTWRGTVGATLSLEFTLR